jgi:hypothetical protein
MKKGVAVLILVSMMLHCAGRLGLLSYLYNQRHAVAYSFGVIAEVPIATCSADYTHHQAPLVIDDQQQSDEQLPVQFMQAKEINLFIEQFFTYDVTKAGETIPSNTLHFEPVYTSPNLPVFHPPCEA